RSIDPRNAPHPLGVKRLEVRTILHRHDVAGTDENRRAGHGPAVELEVTMHDSLPGLRPGGGETGTTHDVIETALAQDQELFAGVPLQTTGRGEVLPQVLVPQAVVELD